MKLFGKFIVILIAIVIMVWLMIKAGLNEPTVQQQCEMKHGVLLHQEYGSPICIKRDVIAA